MEYKLKRAKYRINKTISVGNVSNGETVLDLGCGKNKIIKTLLPKDVDYMGIDIEGGDITHDLENGLPGEISDKKFDVIFLNEFIEHIEYFKTLLMECRDVLSEKGRIIISTPSNNRILYGDFFNGTGEDSAHIHCFRKTNMHTLARICNLRIIKIVGTYIRFPPISHCWIAIPTNQTVYTEVIIYRLEKLVNEYDKKQ